MSSSSTILYDLPSKGDCKCWSPNTWKVRLPLNFKGIPYTTEWVEYPDIAGKFEGFGISPNQVGMLYTIPAAKFSDGTYVMDSANIVEEIEKRYPAPSLHLDSPRMQQFKDENLLGPIVMALRPVWMPKVPKNLLREPSIEYFYRTRSEFVGQDLDEYAREKGGQQCWVEAKPGLDKLSKFIAEKGGPFVEGKEASYVDFLIASMFYFVKRIDEDDFNRIVEGQKPLQDLMKACEPWLERGD